MLFPSTEQVAAAAAENGYKYVRKTLGPTLRLPYYILVGDSSSSLPSHPHLKNVGNLVYDFRRRHWCYLGLDHIWNAVTITEPHVHPYLSVFYLVLGGGMYDIPTWEHPSLERLDQQLTARSSLVVRAENRWLLPIIECWMLQTRNPSHATRTLDELLAHKETLVKFPTILPADMFGGGCDPSSELAINSLWAAASSSDPKHSQHQIEEYKNSGGMVAPGVSVIDFIDHFSNPFPSPRCLGIVDLPVSVIPPQPHPNRDLSSAVVRVPNSMRHNLLFTPDHPSDPLTLARRSTYAMQGALSRLQQHSYIHPQLVYHISGCQLWLLWPQNDHNKQFFSRSLMLFENNVLDGDVPTAIKELSDMQVLLLDEPLTAFIVPMGMYYACLSITKSIHGASPMVDLQQIDQMTALVTQWAKDFQRHHTTVKERPTTMEFTISELLSSPAPKRMMDHLEIWVGVVKREGEGGKQYRTAVEAAARQLVALTKKLRLQFYGEGEDEEIATKETIAHLSKVARGDWA